MERAFSAPSGNPSPVVLGIETSCDDTAAAVVVRGRLASSVVAAQDVHRRYGGVVPELASRDHQRLVLPVVGDALEKAGVALRDLTTVAVTYGPGLAGSLLVGLSFAKALAWARSLDLVGVNHLEGHLFSLFIEEPHPPLPFLCLVVSGGHTQLVVVDEDFRYRTIGRTRDDAAGEAFDKVGKLLGLPYPAGPHVDRLAAGGDPSALPFPRTHLPDLDFSFSGIKTSVLYHVRDRAAAGAPPLDDAGLADLCASFQAAVVSMLVRAVDRALTRVPVRAIGVAGGVSANSGLRTALRELAAKRKLGLYIPRPAWCTDNAAMIAVAGYHRAVAGHLSKLTLTAEPALAL